jgi:hypothetical protein
MAEKKAVKTYNLGNNVLYKQEGTISWFGVDNAVEGTQTKSSQGLDKNGKPKRANEMVGSTGAYTPVPGTDGRVMLHLIRPMTVAAVRKARAIQELDEDDSNELSEDQVAFLLEKAKKQGLI